MLLKYSLKNRLTLATILILSGILLYKGWQLFWFLTDDAYITFRYISNSVLGYGYVWNPPPFRAVEGYSNFLWMLILEYFWKIFDVPPPSSSNYISLFFSYLSLLLATLMTLQIDWEQEYEKYRLWFLTLTIVYITTNRTFLAWTSSGLETALFNFLIFLWIYSCLYISSKNPIYIFLISVSSVLTALTRPDGLLFIAATIFIIFIYFISYQNSFRFKYIIQPAPLLLIVIHFAYRKKTYGEWLPNTYYAKISDIWPESGVKYSLSFIIEYGLWVWFIILFIFSFKKIYSFIKDKPNRRILDHTKKICFSELMGSYFSPMARITVISAIIFHILYYTIAVGGDHFEYRVYSYLIVLLPVSMLWMLNKIKFRLFNSILTIIVFVLLSYPVQWSHWYVTNDLNVPLDHFRQAIPISNKWPEPIRWYAKKFDSLQYWLNYRMVCIRHHKHRLLHEALLKNLPSREEGMLIENNEFPILITGAVGLTSWMLPRVNILDNLGLNDYVAARNKNYEYGIRAMAHSRKAPDGYVECLCPNVFVNSRGDIKIKQRRKKLSGEMIDACEKLWEQKVKIISLSHNQQKKIFDAIKLFSDHWQTSSNFDIAFKELKKIISDKKKNTHEKTLQILKILETYSSKSASLHYRLGKFYNTTLEYDKAIHEFKKALLIEPNMIQAMGDLSEIYVRRNEYDKALLCYKGMISAEPTIATPYYNIACIYSIQNKVDESIAWLEKAIERGYKKWETIKNDKDLQNIRHTLLYQNIKNDHLK